MSTNKKSFKRRAKPIRKKPVKSAKTPRRVFSPPSPSRPSPLPPSSSPKKPLFAFLRKSEENDIDLDAGATTVTDILSPASIDLTRRDMVEVDGVYHAYLYIAGYGYSTAVGSGWLSPLVEAGEGVGLSFVIKRQPREKVIAKIAQSTMVNRSRMREIGDTRSDFEELDSAIASGLYLKENMNRNGEDFYCFRPGQ